MAIIVKRKEEAAESVDSMKILVPEMFAGQHKDPPAAAASEMVQLPHLAYEPTVAVGIMVCRELTFSFDEVFVSPQFPQRIFIDTNTVTCRAGRLIFEGKEFRSLLFEPVNPSDYASPVGCFTLHKVMIGKEFHWQQTESQSFKGTLRLLAAGDHIEVINDIPVEAYLYSVISSEMNAHAPVEFLKAHAVISRSWLLKPIFDAESKAESVRQTCTDDSITRWYERDAHTLFDVCADDHCQRYQGITRATTRSVVEAIEATRGMVLTYGGHICDARFSKCCGGASERFHACWDDNDYHYLQKVVDAPDNTDPAAAADLTVEENASRWIRSQHSSWCNTTDTSLLDTVLNDYDRQTPDFYRWTVHYTTAELSDLVRRRSGIDFGTVTDLQPVERGVSGRLVRLRIVGTKRTVTVGKELEIRRWLSESHLYSSAFVVDRTADGFTLTGAGWGHGVGLCQIGAAAMASKGRKYDGILRHYFTDAEIENIY